MDESSDSQALGSTTRGLSLQENPSSRGGTRYEYSGFRDPAKVAAVMGSPKDRKLPGSKLTGKRQPLLIPQSFIVHNHHGMDSVAAWNKPTTVADGAPRRPPLLNEVAPTHSDEADIDELDGLSLDDLHSSKDTPFANNQRQYLTNPAARQRRKRKRKHSDCFGVLLFIFLVLGSISGYGYCLWRTKFWLSDSSKVKFRIPVWSHPLIVTFIMVEIILLIAFIARWLKSYRR